MPAASVRPWGASGHSRSVGLIVVALVHVAMVAALVEGFRRHAAPPPPKTQVTFEPLDTPMPRPPEPMHIPEPKLNTPDPKWVDIPVIAIEPAAQPTQQPSITPTIATSTAEPTASTGGSSTGPVTVPQQPSLSEPVAPGMVCTQMAVPEMPPTNWSGEAIFRAVAEVHAGRVVAVDIRTLQGAGMDSRTRRAFLNAIDGTLKQRYVCPGDHRFQQDFSFKVD